MSTSETITTEKLYDEMSKPEQEEHDKVARAREQAEQDGEVQSCTPRTYQTLKGRFSRPSTPLPVDTGPEYCYRHCRFTGWNTRKRSQHQHQKEVIKGRLTRARRMVQQQS
jgi:hypothetical protein